MKEFNYMMTDSEKKKLTEQAFLQSIAMSAAGILLCIIALCSATWAWFGAGVSSGSNNIQASNCIVSVAVTNNSNPVDLTNENYELAANQAYTFNITAEGTAKSAYCIFVINELQYYTAQISTESNKNTMTFDLMFDHSTSVKVITRWGTSSVPENERSFANGKLYQNLQEVSAFTVSVTETPETTETTESTETTVSTETQGE